MRLRLLPILALFAGVGIGQQTSTTPDLRVAPVTAQFTTCSATGSTPIYLGNNPATRFRLTFYVDGTNFTAASVGLQGAPAATGGPTGTAGTFTSTTNITLVEGSVSPLANPIASAAQGTIVVSMYYPWVRVLCNSVTGSGGTVYYTLWGYDGTSPATPISPGGGGAITVQSQCQNASLLSSPAVFNLSGSGNTSIITGATGKSIHLCHVSFATIASEDIKFTTGTTGGSANCGTATADATGLYKVVTALALDFQGSFVAPSGTDLCINQSVAQALGGTATYYLQ